MNYEISFIYKDKKIEFANNRAATLYIDLCNWLYKSGYKFQGEIHNAFIRKPFTKDEADDILAKNYSGNNFYQIFFNIEGSDIYLYRGGNINKIYPNILNMLKNFGVDEKTITTKGFERFESKSSSRIKKFGEIDTDVEEFDLEDEDDITPIEEEPVEKIKVYKQNPFKQAICVLGKSGSGKSVTIETILENEDHEFQFIIPTAATTGLLAQFSPSKSGYVPSRLGRMLMEASKNPQTLYTAVFDEMHKSNVIEMINDELLQAISTKRNRGRRFISLDDDTAEIYSSSELETERGNLLIPDNFGFIFISSKPRVIANNADFFNRVDIVILNESDRRMKTSNELLSKILPQEEKDKLSSSRND
jgi:hypothetical protein